jgi:uncharacterized protein (TIGR02679 family)
LSQDFTVVTSRPSLEAPDLTPVWEVVRARLERRGIHQRGRLRVPEVTSRGRYLLGGVVGKPVATMLDLEVLESRLRDLDVGTDLPAALSSLGYPVSPAPAQRRANRRSAEDARAAARAEAADWSEPWAEEWIVGIIRSGVLAGLDSVQAVQLVQDARAVLDRIAVNVDVSDRLSRVDLAANVLGSSHALDWGTRQEAAITRALSLRSGATGREAWERAGIQLDLVSAPVLTWRLEPVAGSPLSILLAETVRLGVPIHLSQLALRTHPVALPEGTDVLVTENPCVVEAAAEGLCPHAVVALNGNPSGAARLLVDQLVRCGAALRYHGDFDAAGLRICARMHRLGLVPWRMDSDSYRQALAVADDDGARLPTDPHRSPPTPWDPDLQTAFDEDRRIVHEERLLAQLLGG